MTALHSKNTLLKLYSRLKGSVTTEEEILSRMVVYNNKSLFIDDSETDMTCAGDVEVRVGKGVQVKLIKIIIILFICCC